MEIFGLPLHPLVVHAAVVLTPLAVLVAIAFAVRPGWRYLLRVPTVVLAVLSAVSVWISKVSGSDLDEQRFAALPADNPLRAAIDTHASRADVLAVDVLVFLVLVLLGARLLGGPSGLVSGRGAKPAGAAWAERTLPAAIVVVGAVTLVWVVLTGDAGSRAVWGS